MQRATLFDNYSYYTGNFRPSGGSPCKAKSHSFRPRPRFLKTKRMPDLKVRYLLVDPLLAHNRAAGHALREPQGNLALRALDRVAAVDDVPLRLTTPPPPRQPHASPCQSRQFSRSCGQDCEHQQQQQQKTKQQQQKKLQKLETKCPWRRATPAAC